MFSNGTEWIAVLVAILSLIWKYIEFRRKWFDVTKIPGPGVLELAPLLRLMFTSREERYNVFNNFWKSIVERFPDGIIKFDVKARLLIFCTKAKTAKVVLSSQKNVTKGDSYAVFAKYFPNGLITSRPSIWHKHRKLLNPAFGVRMLNDYLIVMNKQVSQLREILETTSQRMNHQSFDVTPFVFRCALDIICETASGENFKYQVNQDSTLFKCIATLQNLIDFKTKNSFMPEWLFRLTTIGRQEKSARQCVEDFVDQIIKKKRTILDQTKVVDDNIKTDDDNQIGLKRRLALLDLLLEPASTNNNNQTLTDDDIKDEIKTFIIAGYETTSNTVLFTLFCIANFPAVQAKVIEEIDNIFGESDRDVRPEDLYQMKYLECVIKETLRMFTIQQIISRKLSEDLEIGGYKVPAGTEVVMFLHIINRDPSEYEEPNKFNPDRFLPENSLNRDPYAFVAFSAGVRNCIGQKYAMMEIKVMVSKILRSYTIKSPIDFETLEKSLMCEVSLKPHSGLPIQFTPRTNTFN